MKAYVYQSKQQLKPVFLVLVCAVGSASAQTVNPPEEARGVRLADSLLVLKPQFFNSGLVVVKQGVEVEVSRSLTELTLLVDGDVDALVEAKKARAFAVASLVARPISAVVFGASSAAIIMSMAVSLALSPVMWGVLFASAALGLVGNIVCLSFDYSAKVHFFNAINIYNANQIKMSDAGAPTTVQLAQF